MKHIKLFNESVYEDISQDITEICYDLTDDGKLVFPLKKAHGK